MRCKRCRAVISEGRKACPNCGTLIRKKRGGITLSSQSGVEVNPFVEWINNVVYNIKMAARRDWRLILAIPLTIIGIIIVLSIGISSCSCACSSCGTGKDAKGKFEVRENSRKPSAQFAVGDTLYYISDGTVMSRGGDETYRSVYESVSASDLQSDGEYLYFREENIVKRIEFGKKPVSGSDLAETVLDFSADDGYTLGYFVADGEIYYYLKENESSLTTLYAEAPILSGSVYDFGYMNGRIYYAVSGTDIGNDLYSVKTDGTDQKLAISGISEYQLGGGYIYAVISDGAGSRLVRYDTDGKELVKWDIAGITGGEINSIAANDTWLCLAVTTQSGSAVYRIEHSGTDVASVFPYSTEIVITGISGDWYAFESIIIADGVETGREYSIRNSRSGKSAM